MLIFSYILQEPNVVVQGKPIGFMSLLYIINGNAVFFSGLCIHCGENVLKGCQLHRGLQAAGCRGGRYAVDSNASGRVCVEDALNFQTVFCFFTGGVG